MAARGIEIEGRQSPRGAINLVPLINIVFLLLIFFMLTSTLTTPDAYDVALPESESGATHESEPLVLLIAADGAIAINNEPVALGDLVARFQAALADGASPSVMVKADATATTAAVITAMKRAKLAGIERVALATEGPTR